MATNSRPHKSDTEKKFITQNVSWMPADKVADAILDIAFTTHDLPRMLNLAHPHPIPYQDIMNSVRSAILEQCSLHSDVIPFVPFKEWVDMLDARAQRATESDLETIVRILYPITSTRVH